ncbi:MAG: LysR substrate-binding domain-containing protein, partial [Acetobacteraceae bacterium]
ADLSTKYAFLKNGVGWGSMPRHMVETDLAEGRLVRLDVHRNLVLAMGAFYRASAPPGPAGRWFIDQLKALSCDAEASDEFQ